MLFDMFWTNAPLFVGNIPRDFYGNLITVGSVVKFVGTVTAINTGDSHYGDIQVTPIRPGSSGPFIPDVQDGSFPSPQSPNFYPGSPQLPSAGFGFHPSQLVLGP